MNNESTYSDRESVLIGQLVVHALEDRQWNKYVTYQSRKGHSILPYC